MANPLNQLNVADTQPSTSQIPASTILYLPQSSEQPCDQCLGLNLPCEAIAWTSAYRANILQCRACMSRDDLCRNLPNRWTWNYHNRGVCDRCKLHNIPCQQFTKFGISMCTECERGGQRCVWGLPMEVGAGRGKCDHCKARQSVLDGMGLKQEVVCEWRADGPVERCGSCIEMGREVVACTISGCILENPRFLWWEEKRNVFPPFPSSQTGGN